MEIQEPEIVAEVELEIWIEVETQAEPPQPTPREELITSVHPLALDMPMGEEFLVSWADVVQGGPSAPSIMSAVTPITVTAGEMHQLISTPGVQVTTIPITIPVTSIPEALSIDVQSQLWIKGCQLDEEERIVEMATLTSEEEESDFGQPSTSKLKPIPPLVLLLI